MAFTFGSTPAPASGGFSFGGGSSTTSAPTPATTGFSFGGGATSTTPTASATPSTGFSFGAAATTTTPNAAPTSGFSFSNTTPAATTTNASSFSFGSSTPSTTPAAAMTGFSTMSTASAPTLTPTSTQPQHAMMTANTPYKSLPPNAQKIIDDIYNLIHQHEQTMASVSSMQPLALENVDSASSSSSSSSLLGSKILTIQHGIHQIKQELDIYKQQADEIYTHNQQTFELTFSCGVYPLQATAARRGLLNNNELLPDIHSLVHSASDIAKKLNDTLLENSIRVDYVQGMPSLYLWSVIDDLVERMNDLNGRLVRLNRKIDVKSKSLIEESQRSSTNRGISVSSGKEVIEDLSEAIQEQLNDLVRVADIVARVKKQMEELRRVYKDKILQEKFHIHSSRSVGIGGNVIGAGLSSGVDSAFDPFAEADEREKEYERNIQAEAHRRMIEAARSEPVQSQTTAATAPASATGGLFGSTAPTPASGGLFGSTTAAPASGGLFGSTPAAAAPASGGVFGATPAAAAPAPNGLFGSTTPAPAAGTSFSFGGATPAPATGVGFGSTAANTAAPSGAFNFSGSASSTTRTRRKSGTSRRR